MYRSPLSELVVICWLPSNGHCWPLCMFTCVCNLMYFLSAQPLLDGPSPHFLLCFLLFSDLPHVWRNLKYFYSGSLHLFFLFHSYIVGVSLNWFWVSVPVLTLQKFFLAWWDGSLSKGAFCQTGSSEFDGLWVLPGRKENWLKREVTPTSCPLTSTQTPWHMCPTSPTWMNECNF